VNQFVGQFDITVDAVQVNQFVGHFSSM